MRSPRFHGAGQRHHSKPPRMHRPIGRSPRHQMHHLPPMFGPRHTRRYHRGCSCLGCLVWVLGAMAMLALLIASIL